jgi:hypothetical protein
MTNEEAKLILHAYAPNGRSATDPNFQAALNQARCNRELADWFANEQAIDARISDSLIKSLNPGAHLKSLLLAQTAIIRPIAWWSKRTYQIALAGCAALLVLSSLVWFWHPGPVQFVRYREEMSESAAEGIEPPGEVSRDLFQVRAWLAANELDTSFMMPSGLNDELISGCRVVNWRGNKVYIICYELQNHRTAHLAVINRAALKDAPAESPVFDQIGKVATVSWSRGNHTYMIASTSGVLSDLMKLFN